MLRIAIHLIVVVIFGIGYGQDSFPGLIIIDVKDFKGVQLHISENYSKIYNQKRGKLEAANPFYVKYTEDCEADFMTLIAYTKLDYNSNKVYAITYSICPEGEFSIIDVDDPTKYYGEIYAEKLYIPGNGSIYSSGHVNNTFEVKQKFTFVDEKLVKIEQPFYHVGLTTTSLKPIDLYLTKKLRQPIAHLPVNYPIEILLAEKPYNSGTELYLVKTKFGLVGWTSLEAGQYEDIDAVNLKYFGD